MRGARLPKKAQQGAGASLGDLRGRDRRSFVHHPSSLRMRGVRYGGCFRGSGGRAWHRKPRAGGAASRGCRAGAAFTAKARPAARTRLGRVLRWIRTGFRWAEHGCETRELWRGTELIGAVFADRRARLDALRVRCQKRASSAAKPRPHCNSSRRWSATAAVPGAKRSRRRASRLAPPAFRCAAPRREAGGEGGRSRRTERPLRVAAGRWRKGRLSADVEFAGAPSFPEGGGALCRLSLVQGKRRFLATKPRSGTLRRPFGVLWPAPILPIWAFVVREHPFPLRWGGFRARTRFGGQKSRAREHERASRCVRGRVGRLSRLWAMRSARLPMRNGRGGVCQTARWNGREANVRSKRAKQALGKRWERGTGLTRRNGARALSGALAQTLRRNRLEAAS